MEPITEKRRKERIFFIENELVSPPTTPGNAYLPFS